MLQQLHDMQSRLLSVADDLEVAIQPAPPPSAPARSSFESPAAPAAPATRCRRPSLGRVGGVAVEDLWVSTPAPGADVGLAGLFDEPATDEPDLPDLSDLDLDLGDDRDR